MKPLQLSLGPDDTLQVLVPGTAAEGHHITVPLTLDGLRILRKVLQQARAEAPKIGRDSAPTQWQVDAWLRADAERRREQGGIKIDLADLGL